MRKEEKAEIPVIDKRSKPVALSVVDTAQKWQHNDAKRRNLPFKNSMWRNYAKRG